MGGPKRTLGGSLFSNTVPQELQPLVTPQITIVKANYKPQVDSANADYAKESDPSVPTPTPPKHAGDLSRLFKALASAEGAVNDSIKARRELIEGLETLLSTNKTKLQEEELLSSELATKKNDIDGKRRQVEDRILQGIPAGGNAAELEPERPEEEPLTPPPIESLTPTGTPPPASGNPTGADPVMEQPVNHEEPPPDPSQLPGLVPAQALQPGADLLSSLQTAPMNGSQNANGKVEHSGFDGAYGGPSVKRRKTNEAAKQDFAEFVVGNGIEGIDEDIG